MHGQAKIQHKTASTVILAQPESKYHLWFGLLPFRLNSKSDQLLSCCVDFNHRTVRFAILWRYGFSLQVKGYVTGGGPTAGSPEAEGYPVDWQRTELQEDNRAAGN